MLGGYKQSFVCTRTQGKGRVSPQETEPDLPVSVQVSPAEGWVDSGLLGVRGAEYSSAWTSPFERGGHYHHYPYHSLASGQTTGREHSSAHQQKIGLKIYWAWPCPSEQDPDCLTTSPSHQEISIGPLSLSIRGQTEWKPQSQKTNQTDHMDHSLV